MFARCYCESHVSFPRYGGRGITVCKRWESFENFIADMGPAPSKLHTLDRIKNGRGYYKSNCRWTTIAVQSANKRKRR